MFPCCSCPCLGRESVYMQIPETDSDEETDADLTEEALEYTEAAFRGIIYEEESLAFTSMGYAVLRACNYAQLYMMDHLSRSRRALEASTSENGEELFIGRNVLEMELWAGQVAAEAGVLIMNSIPCVHRNMVRALYFSVRAANVIHSAIDLGSQIFDFVQNGISNGRDQRTLHNMLALTDVLNLSTEAVYFCAPAVRRVHERLSEGTVGTYLTRACSSLRGVGRIVRGALGRLAAVTGAVGVACTAGLGAALTVEFIQDNQDSLEQRAILGAQITVAALATTALSWMVCANRTRADHET